MRSMLLALLATGCALLDAATQDKPSSRQQSAIGDTFTQLGTIASIADDPAATSPGDLLTAIRVSHMAVLVDPSLSIGAAAPPALGAAKPGPIPGCVADTGESVAVDACDLPLGDGRVCPVNGNIGYAPSGDGTRYQGSLTLGGDGCPSGSVTFDATIVGDPSSPSAISGSASFAWSDPPSDDFSGTLSLDGIAVTGDCTVPSTGEMSVTVTGTAAGEGVDGQITLSFHDSPGCGLILIE